MAVAVTFSNSHLESDHVSSWDVDSSLFQICLFTVHRFTDISQSSFDTVYLTITWYMLAVSCVFNHLQRQIHLMGSWALTNRSFRESVICAREHGDFTTRSLWRCVRLWISCLEAKLVVNPIDGEIGVMISLLRPVVLGLVGVVHSSLEVNRRRRL